MTLLLVATSGILGCILARSIINRMARRTTASHAATSRETLIVSAAAGLVAAIATGLLVRHFSQSKR